MRTGRSFPRSYLIFPALAVLVSLLIPADRLALRVLVGAIIAGLGVLMADAGFQPGDMREPLSRLRALLIARPNPRLSVILTATAFVLFVLAAIQFSPIFSPPPMDFTFPVLFTLFGAGSMWLALWFSGLPGTDAAPTEQPLTPAHSIMWMSAAGVLLLLLAGERAGQALGFGLIYRLDLRAQAVLFYGGIALLVLGLGGIRRIRLPRLERPRRAWLFSEGAFVVALFAAALIVRAWNLETGLRISVDEALAVDSVQHYYGGAIGLVGRPSDYTNTLVMPQWQGEIINLIGRSLTGLRLASAIIGALTVVVIYYMGRDLFRDRLLGALGALLLLTFPPHVHFSRISLLHIADPLSGALGIWFLIRAMRGNRRLDWALAGASLGLTQYFFEAGRLFFIPLVAVWLLGAVALSILMRLRNRPQPRIPVKGILIAAFALVLVASPAYYATFSRDQQVNPRLTISGGANFFIEPFQDEDGLTGEEASELIRRVLFPFSVYVHQPEIAVFYGGDQPMLLIYVVPFFLLGCALLIWRWRSLSVILVLWLLFTALTNALLRDSAVYARWHVVFPAAALVSAVGLRCGIALLLQSGRRAAQPDGAPAEAADEPIEAPPTPTRPRWRGIAEMGALAALTSVIVVGQLHYYYAWHTPLLEKQGRESKPYPDGFDVSLRARDMPNFTDIYLISDPIPDINVPRAWIIFFTRADEFMLRYVPMRAFDFTDIFITRLPTDRNLALFIDIQASDAINRAVEAFGCPIQYSPYPIDPPGKAYVLCFVDRGLR